MSFNGWPDHADFRWSRPIPVVSGRLSGLWAVRWLSFKLSEAVNPPQRSDGTYPSTRFEDIPGTEYIFRDDHGDGIDVTLDTGE